MILAYVDESGNSGDPSRGATATYTLGCLLIDADTWPDAFDRFVDFRRQLGRQFGIRMRDEVKANYLLHDKGALRALSLSRGQRTEIYERHFRLAEHLPAQAFAIVIVKDRHQADGPDGVVRRSWTYLAQRLERACRENNDTLMIIHDEGENDEVRRVLRRARRVLSAGSAHDSRYLELPRLRLVDDPVPASPIIRTSPRWPIWSPMRDTGTRSLQGRDCMPSGHVGRARPGHPQRSQ